MTGKNPIQFSGVERLQRNEFEDSSAVLCASAAASLMAKAA
jgi:hypothetical protein